MFVSNQSFADDNSMTTICLLAPLACQEFNRIYGKKVPSISSVETRVPREKPGGIQKPKTTVTKAKNKIGN
jgi:hypothetical protein